MKRILVCDFRYQLRRRWHQAALLVVLSFCTFVVSLVSLSSIAFASPGSFDVAFVTNGVFSPDRSDIIGYLSNDPRVDTAVLLDATVSVPSLSELLVFDAVMYVSDAIGHNRDIDDDLGNVLADFADTGRGLLLTSFAFGSNANDLGLLGRVMSSGYSPFLNRQGQGVGSTFDPTASNLQHPALLNVSSFFSKENNGALSLDPTALLIAQYTNGDPLLAENSAGNILGLNALPSPGTSRGEIFLTGDYTGLIINSLRYAAGFNVVPEPSITVYMMVLTVIGLYSRPPRADGTCRFV